MCKLVLSELIVKSSFNQTNKDTWGAGLIFLNN